MGVHEKFGFGDRFKPGPHIPYGRYFMRVRLSQIEALERDGPFLVNNPNSNLMSGCVVRVSATDDDAKLLEFYRANMCGKKKEENVDVDGNTEDEGITAELSPIKID